MRRMSRLRSPINSVKHINQVSLTSVTLGSIGSQTIANAVQGADATNSLQVEVGSTIAAVYIEMWLLGQDQTASSGNVTLEKSVSGTSDMTYTESQSFYTYTNKNNVFYITQGLVGAADTNPTPFLRGWFKISKGKQAMRLGDKLVLNIAAITADVDFCGVMVFKAYR